MYNSVNTNMYFINETIFLLKNFSSYRGNIYNVLLKNKSFCYLKCLSFIWSLLYYYIKVIVYCIVIPYLLESKLCFFLKNLIYWVGWILQLRNIVKPDICVCMWYIKKKNVFLNSCMDSLNGLGWIFSNNPTMEPHTKAVVKIHSVKYLMI